MIKRVFLIVMDSFGVGAMPDASLYGDEGSNTLASCASSSYFNVPTLTSLGLFNIDGIKANPAVEAIGCFGRMAEASVGKDTTIGHWEIAGIISTRPFQTFPDGFPDEFIAEFSRLTGKRCICNKPYSGTDVIIDYGKQHEETGDLIVYTSADSVFQIAANEGVVSVDELYNYCEIARNLLNEKYRVGRVIARPFVGEYPNYIRTSNRHDYSVEPPKKTILNHLSDNGFDVISVGKINDIFCGSGITDAHKIKSNDEGMEVVAKLTDKDFDGLCFVNLVEFDSVYGHRNDIDGYAKAVSQFDVQLRGLLDKLTDRDLLIVTADHGCDPSTISTDHSREYVPLLVYGKSISANVDLGTRSTFSDIAKTIADIFNIKTDFKAKSFYDLIK